MTLKVFREKTADFPETMEIFVGERLTEFTYGLVNSVSIKEINFSEEPDGEVISREKVIVLQED